MLQRLPILLAQVRASNISKNLLMKSDKSYTFCIELKKLFNKYITIEFNKGIIQNEYYIYEFCKK